MLIDIFGDILAPYSSALGTIAGTIASLQLLSFLLLLREIHNKRSSEAYSFTPFSIGISLSMLALKLGHLMNDAATINTNLFGMVINAFGAFVFYYYASSAKRSNILSLLAMSGAFSSVCLLYANYEDPKTVEARFGLLITVLLVVLVGFPLLSLPEIMAKKSVEGLPFPMIASGALTSMAWTIYGISIKNSVIVYQNLFLLFLASIQLSLFAIYPSTPPSTKAKKVD